MTKGEIAKRSFWAWYDWLPCPHCDRKRGRCLCRLGADDYVAARYFLDRVLGQNNGPYQASSPLAYEPSRGETNAETD